MAVGDQDIVHRRQVFRGEFQRRIIVDEGPQAEKDRVDQDAAAVVADVDAGMFDIGEAQAPMVFYGLPVDLYRYGSCGGIGPAVGIGAQELPFEDVL